MYRCRRRKDLTLRSTEGDGSEGVGVTDEGESEKRIKEKEVGRQFKVETVPRQRLEEIERTREKTS